MNNKVFTINNGALEFCSDDDSSTIVIPDGVKVIGNDVFEDFKNLKKIVIPKSVKTIGDWSFYKCKNLRGIGFTSEGVTKIGKGAYSECDSLRVVTLPNGVIEIGELAFSGCSNLVSIYIPDSVKHIGENVFDDCQVLDISYQGTKEQWDSLVSNVNLGETLDVRYHFNTKGLVYKGKTLVELPTLIELSKVSELTLRNDDNDCQTVLKARNLWGDTSRFKGTRFPSKLAKDINTFICEYYNMGNGVPPTLDKHWLHHLYMNEDKDMIMDIFNGEDNGLYYLNDKVYIKGEGSFNITKDVNNGNVNPKVLKALSKVTSYTSKNNIADIWYLCNECDYTFDIENVDESYKDIVKAVSKADGQGVDLLIEEEYKRGTMMVYKYSENVKGGKWALKGEFCLVIC